MPKEFQGRSQNYVEAVCKDMVPQVAKWKLAQFVDVFCEKGAFTAAETEQVFAAAKQHGLSVRAHVGQLSETEVRPLLQFNPASVSYTHLTRADCKFQSGWPLVKLGEVQRTRARRSDDVRTCLLYTSRTIPRTWKPWSKAKTSRARKFASCEKFPSTP